MPDCVQQATTSGADPALCGVERAARLRGASRRGRTSGLTCPRNVRVSSTSRTGSADRPFCPAVIGNVLVYLDDNHLTASYATSMARPDRG